MAEAVDELLVLFVDPGVGHTETPRMRRAVREFLDHHLLKRGQGLSATLRRDIDGLRG